VAHEHESSFVVRVPAWHGLSTVVDEALNAPEAIRMAGLDWLVVKEPTHRPNGEVIPNRFSTIRLSDDTVLGSVGDVYEPIQNGDLFTFFDSVFDREEGRYYHTGGSLKNGKVVWLLAKLPGDFYVVNDDKVENYVLLASSHDGSVSLMAKHSPVRVVCANTLAMAIRGMGMSVKIRHTRNYAMALSEASKAMGLAQRRMNVMQQVAADMVRRQVNSQNVGKFLENMFPGKKKDGSTTKQAITRRNIVTRLFANSETNNLPGMQGSMWSLYNAFTEYVDHDMPTRGKNSNAGFRSLIGVGATMKVRASRYLLDLV